VALYAFNHELARVAEVAREPLMQEIRLTWWSEALDEIFAGGPVRRHPVVEALSELVGRRGPPRAPFAAMIDARLQALDAATLADEAAVYRHIDATAGAVMELAAGLLAPRAGLDAVPPAARAWGLSGLARMRAVGEDRLPKSWSVDEVRSRIRAAMTEARDVARVLPVAAFPAVVYVTLARAYAAGRAPSDLEKRLRLTGAVLSGRL
jgi:15-cis-phytoene synthase